MARESEIVPPVETLDKRVTLPTLFVAFFRVGLTAFGGPAMIPHLRMLVVERNFWISEEDFRLGLSICQAIPGATVMQLAAYVGLRVHGLAGALTAFCGFGAPAFFLITGLSAVYFQYRHFPVTLSVFAGLKVIVLAILLSATFDFIKKYVRSVIDALLAAGAAAGILLQFHPAVIILVGMLLGIVTYGNKTQPGRRKEDGQCLASRNGALKLGGCIALWLFILWMATPDLFWLALQMMRIDILAFGGGFAALPIMLHEVLANTWGMSEQTFLDGIALGQITPGPIVITAAFVGYAQSGLSGALTATVGIFSPSIVMLVWVVPHCDRLLGSVSFQRAMRASLATLAGLMAAMSVTLAMPLTWHTSVVALGVCAFIALRFRTDVVWVVLLGGIVAIFLPH